jgi:sugar phosphate isomerase/epimerase
VTRLSLDCLTLTDTNPTDLIRAAAAAGFDLVSLWVNPPAAYPRALLTPAMARECAALMDGTGVSVHGIEAFDMVSVQGVRAFRPALELGARLGAKSVLAYHGANPERAEVSEALASFVELAGEHGLRVNLEPVAIGRTRTLAEAEALIRDAGAEAGILFDCCHLVRSGSSIDDLRAIAPGRIRYIQINDGPAQMAPGAMLAEASGERLYPGEGEFPLAEIMRLLPTDVPWGIEAPSLRRARAGLSAEAQAREAMAALRVLLTALQDIPGLPAIT